MYHFISLISRKRREKKEGIDILTIDLLYTIINYPLWIRLTFNGRHYFTLA